MSRRLITIGRREYIDIPELDSWKIESKIDTGAFRTAIHCVQCREVEVGGKTVLEAAFDLDGKGTRTVIFESFSLRTIRNSFGQSEKRFCVPLMLQIGRRKIRSDVSLSDRSGMKYQVLLGRKTLGRKFLVDVGWTHLLQADRRAD
jgi:hypothetical protein